MQVGIGSYTFPWAIGVPGFAPPAPLTAFGLLERAAALRVGVVQICDNLPLHQLSEPDQEALRARAEALGIQIEVGTRGIHPEHVRAYLALARRFRSPVLRVVIDTADHRPDPGEVVGLLAPLMPEFERAGVCLAIENHDRFPARVLAGIVERLASPCAGICLDTVNSFGALEGPDVVIEALAPYTVSLHVKDFVIRRASHQMGFTIEGAIAGEGRLDIPRLLSAIRSAGRDPNAILELWTPLADSVADTIAREAAWAERSVAYLRGLLPTR